MELKKICEKIIDDANIKAAGITEEANRNALELINSADKKHNEKAEKIRANAPLISKEIFDRILSDATLAAKKEILSEKRVLIASAFKKAEEKLENLSLEEYKSLLTAKAKEITAPAEVEILKKYSKDIKDEFLKSVNPLLSKSKNNAASGFNFVFESSRLNYNFSEAVSRIMEEKDSDVASILFS